MERGQPAKYKTPKELEKAIDKYFSTRVPTPIVYEKDGEDTVLMDARGNPVTVLNPPTVAGLALHLGYATRQSLYDQPERGEDFSYVIKKAITAIENFHEERLSTATASGGSMFWMKNHGWSDRQEINMSGIEPKLILNSPKPDPIASGLADGTVEIQE